MARSSVCPKQTKNQMHPAREYDVQRLGKESVPSTRPLCIIFLHALRQGAGAVLTHLLSDIHLEGL